MTKEQDVTGIRQAVFMAGSQTKLAEALDVTKQSVNAWLRQGFVPSTRVEQIYKLYGISRSRLCNPRFLKWSSNDEPLPEE